MKKAKATQSAAPDTMHPEYDLTGGVRGKHAAAMRRGYTRTVHHADGTREITEVRPLEGSIVLDPDVQVYFPDAEAVNTALRGLIALRPRRRPTHAAPARPLQRPRRGGHRRAPEPSQEGRPMEETVCKDRPG